MLRHPLVFADLPKRAAECLEFVEIADRAMKTLGTRVVSLMDSTEFAGMAKAGELRDSARRKLLGLWGEMKSAFADARSDGPEKEDWAVLQVRARIEQALDELEMVGRRCCEVGESIPIEEAIMPPTPLEMDFAPLLIAAPRLGARDTGAIDDFIKQYNGFVGMVEHLKFTQQKVLSELDGVLKKAKDLKQDSKTLEEWTEMKQMEFANEFNRDEAITTQHELWKLSIKCDDWLVEMCVERELDERRKTIGELLKIILALKQKFLDENVREGEVLTDFRIKQRDRASAEDRQMSAKMLEETTAKIAKLKREYQDVSMRIQRLCLSSGHNALVPLFEDDDQFENCKCDFPELFMAAKDLFECSDDSHSQSGYETLLTNCYETLLTNCNMLLPYNKSRFEMSAIPVRMEKILFNASTVEGAVLKTNDDDDDDDEDNASYFIRLKVLKRVDDIRKLRRALVFSRQVRHKSILASDGAFIDNGIVFLQLPFCSGGNLNQWVLEKARPLSSKLDVLAYIGDALSALHKHGIVHRDLKPQNIVMSTNCDDAIPMLTDFDSSIDVQKEIALTMKTSGVGNGMTTLFLAPEVKQGESKASKASDVFAFAATAVLLICDKPFPSGMFLETYDFAFQLQNQSPPIEKLLADFCPASDELVKKWQAALSSNPSNRPTADSLSNAFARRKCALAVSCKEGECNILFASGDVRCNVHAHYFCKRDFETYVKFNTTADLQKQKQCHGNIVCPACYPEKVVEFSFDELSKALRPALFEATINTRTKIERLLAEEDAERRGNQRLREQEIQLLNASRVGFEVQLARNKVANFLSALTPCCEVAWELIDGCMAITCTTCGVKFCGFCNELCPAGKDVHALVKSCRYNPNAGGDLFASKETFQRVRKSLQIEFMKATYSGLSADAKGAFRGDVNVKSWILDLGVDLR